MRDFTIDIYLQLLSALEYADYQFSTYHDLHISPATASRTIVLRHDVDARKLNTLQFARIQHSRGINGTYYFRVVPGSYDEEVIREVSDLGHEIGYHYETMDSCKGNVDKAYYEFCRHLERFRKLVPIRTICMHGSPLSKFDNRDIWKKYNYQALGIEAEPYFDLDFNNVFYLTDTGRKWDGATVSIRDKPIQPVTNPDFTKLRFHHTSDIIKAAKSKDLPQRVMFTFHPQRWTNSYSLWLQELLTQNAKNAIKALMVR